MSAAFGVIREFRIGNVQVIVDALPEDDLDLSWDDTGEIRENLESGRYVAFVARARAFYDGHELASDYLGGCIYESLEAFQDHRECGAATRKLRADGSNAICGSYFADMVRSVCQDARKELRKLQGVKVRQ